MYRAGLYGLLASVLCVSLTQAQNIPANGQPLLGAPYVAAPPQLSPQPVSYVWSEPVTCSCGQENENYAGGPRACSHCGEALPEPPEAVAQTSYCPDGSCSSGGPEGYYEAYAADFGCPGDCGCSSCGGGGGGGLKALFSKLSLCDGPSPCSTVLATPPMIGGGFTGARSMQLQGTRLLTGNLVATGTLVGANLGVNSSLQFNVATTVANPDFQSVGVGSVTGGLISFNVVESIPGAIPGCPPGSTILSATATEQVGGGIISPEAWNIALNCQQTFNILVPNAANAGAAVVGRTRVADNNSPLPRSRVFFDYSFLDNVPLSSSGVSVNRFTPGMEWATGGGKSSIELRIPYAITMSSDVDVDGATATGRGELGDIFLSYKQLLYQSENIVLSGGVGLTLPSANDLNILSNGTSLLYVENQAIHLMPYLASIVNLTGRTFTQGFIQVDTDVVGNQVYVNPPAVSSGRLRDTTRLYADFALGYWLRKRGENRDAIFNAIIPTFELHYDSTLENPSAFTAGSFVLGSNTGSVSNTNLVFGSTFEFSDASAVSLGFTMPVGNSSDQLFDGGLRVLWNRYL